MIANPITLKNFSAKDNMLHEEVGGTEYLVKLTRFSGSSQTSGGLCKNYSRNVFEKRVAVLISDKLSI